MHVERNFQFILFYYFRDEFNFKFSLNSWKQCYDFWDIFGIFNLICCYDFILIIRRSFTNSIYLLLLLGSFGRYPWQPTIAYIGSQLYPHNPVYLTHFQDWLEFYFCFHTIYESDFSFEMVTQLYACPKINFVYSNHLNDGEAEVYINRYLKSSSSARTNYKVTFGYFYFMAQ